MNTQQQYLSEEAVRALCGKGEPHRTSYWPLDSFTDGWRPCLKGEGRADGDEMQCGGEWVVYDTLSTYGKAATGGNFPTRTKRELPPEAQPDKPAESLVGKTVWFVNKHNGLVYEAAIEKCDSKTAWGDHKAWKGGGWTKSYGRGEFVLSLYTIHHSDPTKPEWRLPVPPDGREWQRPSIWTQEMLPDGWRPILKGEPVQEGDEINIDPASKNPSWATLQADGESFGWRLVGQATVSTTNAVRTRRPIPKSETPATVSSPREPNELRYDKVEIGMSLWARSRRYPGLCYKLNRVRRITIDSFYADYTCLTHSTYGDTAFAINDYKFYSADPRETPATEPAKVEAFVPTKGQRIQKKNSGEWSEPYVADYDDSLYAAAVRGGAEFRLAEEPKPTDTEPWVPQRGEAFQRLLESGEWSETYIAKNGATEYRSKARKGAKYRPAPKPQPTEPMPALVISTTGTGDDDFARAAQRQQKANDAAAAMRLVLDSYKPKQPEPNLNNMNAQQSNTQTRPVSPVIVGARYVLGGNDGIVIASDVNGIVLDIGTKKAPKAIPYSVKGWHDSEPVRIWSKKELRKQAKADRQAMNSIRNAAYVGYGGGIQQKPLWKRIRNWTLSRGFYYSLGGLTGHLAASAILSAVAYLTALWAQHIAK